MQWDSTHAIVVHLCYTHSHCTLYWCQSQVYSCDKWVPVKLPGVVGGVTCLRPHNTSELQSAEATRMAETHQVCQDEQTCCVFSSVAPSHCKHADGEPELTAQEGQEGEDGGVVLQCEPSTKQTGGVEEESISGVPMEDCLPQPDDNVDQGHGIDCCDSDGDGDSDDVDDDEGWITPDNIDQARIEMGGCVGEELGDIRVGCMTTDFAMQVSERCWQSLMHVREKGTCSARRN